MNNACPGCGAVYAVTSRDIGRKLKCKKCSTALVVTEAGLVADTPAAAPVAATPADDFDTGDEGGVVKKKARRYGGGAGVGELVEKIGGVPTVLFGFGVFLVVFFFFMPKISDASVSRAKGRIDRLALEANQKLRKEIKDQEEIEKMTPEAQTEYIKNLEKRKKEITKEFKPKKEEADDDVAYAQIDKQRSVWWDRYGLMFGFLFLSFGCIGYIRSDQPLLVKIVAGTILSAMLLFVFGEMSGCQFPGAGGRMPGG